MSPLAGKVAGEAAAEAKQEMELAATPDSRRTAAGMEAVQATAEAAEETKVGVAWAKATEVGAEQGVGTAGRAAHTPEPQPA